MPKPIESRLAGRFAFYSNQLVRAVKQNRENDNNQLFEKISKHPCENVPVKDVINGCKKFSSTGGKVAHYLSFVLT